MGAIQLPEGSTENTELVPYFNIEGGGILTVHSSAMSTIARAALA